MPYTYTPPRQYIVLPDDDSLLMGYLRITLKPCATEWDIREIALFATREIAEANGACLADDIQLTDLSPSGQMRVTAALNAWDHERREGAQRTAAEAYRAVMA